MGSRHGSLRTTGARGLSDSLIRLRSETMATQILPSRPVEMLSG
jgi:hypothetical protein